MERLIDMDKLVSVLEHAGGGRNSQYVYRKVAEYVRAMPTVDAVEVVRCKDCEHYSADGWGYGNCYRPNVAYLRMNDNGFCSWGERREDGK